MSSNVSFKNLVPLVIVPLLGALPLTRGRDGPSGPSDSRDGHGSHWVCKTTKTNGTSGWREDGCVPPHDNACYSDITEVCAEETSGDFYTRVNEQVFQGCAFSYQRCR